jgi:hypothetical protein
LIFGLVRSSWYLSSLAREKERVVVEALEQALGDVLVHHALLQSPREEEHDSSKLSVVPIGKITCIWQLHVSVVGP